jgi:hAT family C-terminal dimerisation region
LVQFLKIFKTATEAFSGSKYPTISLVLLFRAEIVAAIADLASDCEMVRSMKQRMRQALNHRLPITELNLIAAMLDPSQRHLNSVQEFLTAQKITAAELLSHAFDKYVGTETELGLHQAGQHMASVENPGPSTPVPWKKAKQDLLSKHVNATSNPDREIQQYRCLSIAPDDVLAWRCTQQETYPRLSMLARVILALPATSASSERIFSTAGLMVNAKRSSLAPSAVDKIVFVHENSHLIKERTD